MKIKSLYFFFLIAFFISTTEKIYSQKKKTFKVALILPFCSNFDDKELTKKKLNQIRNSSIDYYNGIQMALQEMKNFATDTEIELNVYDTQRDSLTTLNIFEKPEIKTMDFIIGPLFKEGIDMATNYGLKYQICHLSPIVSQASATEDKFLVRPNPDVMYMAQKVFNFISKNFADAEIIVCTDNKKTAKIFTNQFDQTNDDTIKIKQLKVDKKSNLNDNLSENKRTVFIMPLTDQPLVSYLLKTLNDTSKDVTVFGMQQWLDFKSNDYLKWNQLKMHIVSGYYINYEDEKVKYFVSNFSKKNYTDPSEIAFKGYDHMICFLSAIQKNNISFSENPELLNCSETLHNSMKFVTDSSSKNIVNSSSLILKFENFKLKKVD